MLKYRENVWKSLRCLLVHKSELPTLTLEKDKHHLPSIQFVIEVCRCVFI